MGPSPYYMIVYKDLDGVSNNIPHSFRLKVDAVRVAQHLASENKAFDYRVVEISHSLANKVIWKSDNKINLQ